MVSRIRVAILSIGLAVTTGFVCAQSPHDCVLIVNAAHPPSLEVANHYRDLRKIPDEQVIYLHPSASHLNASGAFPWVCKEPVFKEQIHQPVMKWLDDHWTGRQVPPVFLLSPGLPTSVFQKGKPVLSTSSYFMYKGWRSSPDLMKSGTYISPWYRGPDRRGENILPSISLPALLPPEAKGKSPTMMIGAFYGAMTSDLMLAQLKSSVKADGTPPSGPVLFLTNQNIRSTCRQWQFKQAVDRLKLLGVEARIQPDNHAFPKEVAGVMCGRLNIPERLPNRLQPGGYADHLTSFSATFQIEKQDKITEWLLGGASASAGPVQEPYAIWTKFPSARVFEHLRMGCTMLEAITQSTASPLQNLPLGDALSTPWKKTFPMKLALRNEVQLDISPSDPNTMYALYTDGVLTTDTPPPWRIPSPAERPKEGTTYTVYAKRQGQVSPRSIAELHVKGSKEPPVKIEGFNARVRVSSLDAHAIDWKLTGTDPGHWISLWKGTEKLWEGRMKDSPIRVSAKKLGAGPSLLQLRINDKRWSKQRVTVEIP